MDNIRETPKETANLDKAERALGEMLDSITSKRLMYLWERWQDEKEYEDFGEYITRAKELIESHRGFTFVKMTKGFGITMKYQPNIVVTVKAKVARNNRGVTWVGKLQLA